MVNQPLEWNSEHDSQARQAWANSPRMTLKPDVKSRRATLTGHCSRCNHFFTINRPLRVVPERLKGSGTTSPTAIASLGFGWPFRRPHKWQPFTLACNCNELHPGRPADIETGCGISGQFNP
jgi:hypothetical protein